MSNINVNCNNSIQIRGSEVIYVDPYKLNKTTNDADYIFCTHSHYDHFSLEDIKKVLKADTKIITVESAKMDALKLIDNKNLLIVEPDRNYTIDNIKFCTTYAYNVDKPFHPKENKWVGFIIYLDNKKYFIAGDTDNIPELQEIKADVAFLPVGGTYTMDYKEAASLANRIDVKQVVPTHYGSVSGDKEDGKKFKSIVKDKEAIIFEL